MTRFLPHALALTLALTASAALAAPSILDISKSITDDNVVPPESFETKVRELEENFYLQNFVAADTPGTDPRPGTPKEYEKRLASLPAEVEMPYNSIVGNFIEMYIGRRRELVANMLALHSYYGNIFIEELSREGVPLELQYLPVIESAINPVAVSRAGATGLWQFMAPTAKGLGMEINSLVDERRDPRSSSRNAARYLRQLHDIYDDWSLAIAAYNCGPGNVNKAIRRAGGAEKMDFWQIYEYLPKETRGYVPAFIAANYVMNFYRHHGISPTVMKRSLVTDTVQVNKRVHFNQIAEVLNIPVEEIRMLNPQFVKDIIPGNFHPYTLTLPKQQVLSYIISEDAILAHDADLYAQRTYVEPGMAADTDLGIIDESGARNLAASDRQSANADDNLALAQDIASPDSVTRISHTVGRGENLKDIAKRYGVSATDIKRWNKLRRGKVKEGDVLVVEVALGVSAGRPSVITRPRALPTPDSTAMAQSDVPLPSRQSAAAAAARNGQAEQPQAAPVPEPKKSPKPAADTPAPAKKKDTAKPKADTKKKAAEKKPASYTVKAGDNLYQIAKRNGTTVDAIKKANNMTSDNIHPGQSLKMPGKGGASKTPAKKSSSKKKKKRR